MLKCFYDAPPEIVEKQLIFRRQRKMARDASYNSLATLGVVMDFLERRIEVQLGARGLACGTISSFDENYHLVAFDDGTQRWFSLDHKNGKAQQMLRDADGTFSMVGPTLASRLV